MQTYLDHLVKLDDRRYIYGLFDACGRCRYAGQTNWPRNRLITHRHLKHGKIRRHGEMTFRVFRTCAFADAARIERQIVQALRRRRQCDLNARDCFTVPERIAQRIIWHEAGQTFPTLDRAARHFRVTGPTIHNWIANRGTAPAGVTLDYPA